MQTGSLHFTHDSSTDAAYIYLRYPLERYDVARTDFVSLETAPSCSVVYSYDEYDRLVSIEILGASKLLPPELMA